MSSNLFDYFHYYNAAASVHLSPDFYKILKCANILNYPCKHIFNVDQLSDEDDRNNNGPRNQIWTTNNSFDKTKDGVRMNHSSSRESTTDQVGDIWWVTWLTSCEWPREGDQRRVTQGEHNWPGGWHLALFRDTTKLWTSKQAWGMHRNSSVLHGCPMFDDDDGDDDDEYDDDEDDNYELSIRILVTTTITTKLLLLLLQLLLPQQQLL